MSDFLSPFATITQIKEGLEKKEFTPKEVAQFFFQRAQALNPELNALIEIFPDRLSPQQGSEQGLLFGIPAVIKDNLCIKGKIASAGSNILRHFKPTYDANVVERLAQAGTVFMGRGNMDEFAMGSSGEFSAYGPSKNPWNTTRSPGGSSSGSAAAVAAGMAPFAIGSETGGSVRQPAAFCGLVGMYPTYGLVSRFGLIPFGSSLDQPGPLTRTVFDNALVMSVIAGHNPADSTSLPEPRKNFTKKLTGKMPEGLKIGIIRESVESEGVHPEIKDKFLKAVKVLEHLGASVKFIDLPDIKYGNSVYFIISRAEAASNLAKIDGVLWGDRRKAQDLQNLYTNARTTGFGAEVKRRILLGNYVLSSEHRYLFDKANHARAMIRADFAQAFSEVDLLISPTSSTLPFELGKDIQDPLQVYMSDYFTVPSCVAGLPGISLPCGFASNGLPIGFQFIGPRLSEELLFSVAYAFEQKTGYYQETPKI